MSAIRTILVDDEPLARERLGALLGRHDDFDLLRACAGGAEAIDAIREQRPDVVFLDVQMPEVDGFDVLLALDDDEEEMPLIVFATAFEEHAVRAFEFHAADYLLKPITRERFEQALVALRARLRPTRAAQPGVAGLASALRDGAADRLVIKAEGRLLFLPVREIDWIQAAGNYLRVHTGSDFHLVRETMSAMEERLAAAPIARAGRSALVNLERIRELRPTPAGDLKLTLIDGTELPVSRRYRAAFEERLQG